MRAAMPTVGVRFGAPVGRGSACRRGRAHVTKCKAAADATQGKKRPTYVPGRIDDPNYVRCVGRKRTYRGERSVCDAYDGAWKYV